MNKFIVRRVCWKWEKDSLGFRSPTYWEDVLVDKSSVCLLFWHNAQGMCTGIYENISSDCFAWLGSCIQSGRRRWERRREGFSLSWEFSLGIGDIRSYERRLKVIRLGANIVFIVCVVIYRIRLLLIPPLGKVNLTFDKKFLLCYLYWWCLWESGNGSKLDDNQQNSIVFCKILVILSHLGRQLDG